MSAPTPPQGTPAAHASADGPVPATPGLLRSINNRVVLDLLIRNGSLTRGDVRTLTGLSKPTASQLLTRLEESKLVVASGFGSPRPGGRAPQLYELNPRSGFAAALEVTPSSVHAVIADITGAEIASVLLPATDTAFGPELAISALSMACETAKIAAADLSSVVVGAPGSYDPELDQLLFSDHLAGWQQAGLVAALSRSIGAAVFVENDVNLVAVAEQRAAQQPDEDFFLLWIDERIGGSIVINGQLYRGRHGGAGEAAFLQLPGVATVRDPARDNHGGFEDLAGQEAVVALARVAGLPADDAPTAVAAAVASHPALLTEIAGRYAVGLSSVVALLDPARVVIAGSVVRAGGEELRREIESELAAVAITTPPISTGQVIDAPILRGALLLSLDNTRDLVFAT